VTNNQKILLGCGGVGCLGLIVLVVVLGVFGVSIFSEVQRQARIIEEGNANTGNSNTNSATANNNSNDDGDYDASYDASLSEDEKHKLFQAAGITQDQALIMRVLRKIGFVDRNGGINDDYQKFVEAHAEWAKKNLKFIISTSKPDKARAYLDENL